MDIPLPDADISYLHDFISHDESIQYLETLLTEVAWQQNEIKMFGKVVNEPRLTAWYGDHGLSYKYSGIHLVSTPWSDLLNELKSKVNAAASTEFNSALLNYYRDGQDSMGYHQDNEPELGQNPVIASLTFGAARRFQLKHITDKSIKRKDISLKSGSLLIMAGATQHYWKHQIPKTKIPIGPRLNITFRVIKDVDDQRRT